MNYRADIDGLRAFAVVSVLCFHSGLAAFRGGFVGVDVFFVISGYLITGIIVSEIDAGTFSIRSFYQRRVRRIFPALVSVLAFALALGFLVLTPSDLVELAKSSLAAAFFVSNMFFWQHIGYFDTAAGQKPLLHTWSLAIEEQYYMAYPFLIAALSRFYPRFRTPAVIAGAALSFLTAVVVTYIKPSAAFYLGPTRAWELLAGGMLALWPSPNVNRATFNLIASPLGMGLLLIAVLFYNPLIRFPGFAALLPVLGAALIIWSGRGPPTLVHRWLSARPVVAIGKASYSLYLWHFPILAFAAYVTLHGTTPLTNVGLCLIAVCISFASLRYVEKPFRFPGAGARTAPLIALSLGSMAVVVAVSAWILINNGTPSRFSSELQAALRVEDERSAVHHWECMSLESRIVPPSKACKLGVPGKTPHVLLWGDSHSVVTATALEQSAQRNQAAFLFAASVDCPIGLGFEIDAATGPAFVSTPAYQNCGKYNEEMLQTALRQVNISTIVLSSRWTNWRVGAPSSPGEAHYDIRLRGPQGVARDTSGNGAIFARGLEQLVAKLEAAGKSVWIVGPVPEPFVSVPKALFVKALGIDSTSLDITRAEFEGRNAFVLDLFKHIAAAYPVHFVRPADTLCDANRCPVDENGAPLYFDNNHLSLRAVTKTSHLYDRIWQSD